jgi:predicted transcriptional regulator
MDNVNEKILADYRLIVTRLDVMKAEVDELNKANKKLKKAFIELLEAYQGELDRRDSIEDRSDVEYYWVEKAGILD